MTHKIKALNVAIGLIVIGMNGAVSAQIQGAGSPSSSNLEALSPQPLPPKATQAIQINSGLNALNPQPLPPKEIQALQRPRITALNPQPLPPNGNVNVRAIKSLRETEGLPDTANVTINGRTANLGELRKGVVIGGSIAKSSGVIMKFSAKFAERFAGTPNDAITTLAKKPQPWVKHELPKERWKLVGCGDTTHDKYHRNHCNGSDLDNAQADAQCLQKLLLKAVSAFGVVYCGVSGGSRAGGFHSKYNANNQEKKSGIDVYEIQINPACKYEHWWTSPYSTVTVDSMVPQQGTVRAIARWTTDRCVSAKSTFLGETIDEDYACMASYYNTKTTVECPVGISP
jgi:hypothetical protein